MPRTAGRGLLKTYGGKITAGRDPKNAGRGRRYFLKFSRASERGATMPGDKRRANCAGIGTRAAGRDTRGAALKTRIPVSGQKTAENRQKSKNRASRPLGEAAQARAMFFSNNMVKNDMNVSRETLPIFCAIMRGLLTD